MRAGKWKYGDSAPGFGLLFAIILAWSTAVLGERLPLRSYTSADGLSSSAIFDITRDPRGFLWISSRDGLIRFDGYRFVTYRFGNGDADPTVHSLLATRGGVYWIDLNRGTDYRFVPQIDATTVAPVGPPTTPDDPRLPLTAEPIIDTPLPLFEDRAGNLWTSDATGLYLLSEVDGRLVSHHIPLNLPENPEKAISFVNFYDGEDSLWAGTNWGVVRRLHDGRIVHYNIRPAGKDDLVISLAEDRDGRVWISRFDGLFVMKPEPLSSLGGLGDFTTRKLIIKAGHVGDDGRPQLPEKADEAVAFTSEDLLHIDSKAAQEKPPAKPMIYKLLRASDGRIWISTSRGLIVFDGQQLRRYTTQQGLNHANGIAEDNEGNIWIGGNGGLMRLNTKGLITFDSADGLIDPAVRNIFEDRNGELHIVGNGIALGHPIISRLANGGFVTSHPVLPEGTTTTWLSNIALLDSHNELWMATQQKLYRYSGVNRIEDVSGKRPTTSYSRRDGLSGDAIYRIFEDSRGDLWISTRRGSETDTQRGLTRWERATARFHAFSEVEGFPPEVSPSAFAEDRSGALWLGLSDGGLVRYRDGRFTRFSEQEGVPAGTVTDLHLDRSGRLWLASSRGGLGRLDDPSAPLPSFKSFTIADGLASNNIRCITEDLFGNIYAGTVRGVNRLSPDTGRVRYYGIADGLAGDFVTVAYRDRQGALWFGTYNGVSKLVPEPDQPSTEPPILIGGLRIAGVDYAVSPLGQSEIVGPELSANQNDLEIDYSSISVGAAAALHYQYKLEGADQDWSAPTTQRSISYASLSPGAYRFLVRAVGVDGTTSAKPATISFRILRPMWQRWWFVTIAALFVFGAASLLYKYRVNHLLEVERVRTRIATDLHDDIGASLSRMAILSEVVKLQNDGQNERSSRMLTDISDSARSLVDSMSDIVWSIDPRRDDLQSVVRRVRQFAADVLESQGIKWDLLIAADLAQVKLQPEERRHLFLIFKEALTNIARHASCTGVLVQLTVAGHQLRAEISDDGKGFLAIPRSAGANGRGGHGVENMRARAAQLGGRLEIDSTAGVGTRLTLTMPLAEQHGMNMLFSRLRK
ncbi:MAG TPA: two-component regulator propeller domain-containing protein [Pyrinomonadaceae bacterium]